jgi:uncharacterized integral membrane protein
MGRILFSIVSLVVLSIVIVMNAGLTTGFNLLGWQFEDVPVVVIAIVSFVAGAIYSFVFYLSSYLSRSRKEKLAMQKERLKSQEQSMKTKDETLKEREKQMTALASEAGAPRQIPAPTGSEPYAQAHGHASGRSGASKKASGGWLRNLFGGKTASGR